jgi:DNA-binding NarL/FixJ family response regulator
MPAPHPQPTRSGLRPLRILIADDHAIFRDGLVGLITQDAGMQVVGEAADGVEAVELARELQPDVLIVDISMPRMNGLQVTGVLSREMPQLKIVGLSMHERQDIARAMRAAGAAVYLTKSAPWEDLLAVLRQLAPGEPRPAQ